MLPSTVVRVDDRTPVAWGFMGKPGLALSCCVETLTDFIAGLDGTIMTVHVEVSVELANGLLLSTTDDVQEPYRRLGLAKALACKLMREHLPKYGDDGWGAADVFVENHKSQAMCRSIGGKVGWTLSW